jgi:hypothetical protein
MGLAALIRYPLEVVESAIPELVADGRIREIDTGYVAPNFLEAQEAPHSDKHRAREYRARRRNETLISDPSIPMSEVAHSAAPAEHGANGNGYSVTKRDASVTPDSDVVTIVTQRHESVTPSDPSDPSDKERESAGARAIPRRFAPQLSPIPSGFSPERSEETCAEENAAAARGVSVGIELKNFGDHCRSKALKSADFNAEWRKWIRRAKPTANGRTPSESAPKASGSASRRPLNGTPAPISAAERAEVARMNAELVESLSYQPPAPRSPPALEPGLAWTQDDDGPENDE